MNKLKSNWEVYKLQEPQHKKINTPKETSIPFQENFKIYLRVKPLPHINHRNQSIKIINEREIQIIPPYFSTQPDRIFQYEQVFGQQATNQQVFVRTMQEPISNVLSGYNSTVFIYGMTGAGKTYTMFNSINSTPQHNQSEGIVGLAINKLFQEIRCDEKNNFQVFLSFYQIYNQNIRDLLCDSAHQQQLSIMQDPIKGIIINQLTQMCVEDSFQARRMIEQCLNKRSINATKNNEYSSRSHAILQFVIKKYIPQEKTNEIAMHQSKLFLIDLAGNEKAGQNQSKRFVQGININKSLLTLGKCINILSQQRKPAFIPYRDSKLTRILKDSLGGNSKTVMIACISAQAKFYQQTLNTLKYSTKARKIKNKGKSASIKLISKKQMPREIVKREQNDEDFEEERLYSLINHLQVSLEEKVRIEKMREDLQNCYQQNKERFQNDRENRIYQANMKQINQLLLLISAKYSGIQKSIEEQVKRFMADEEKHKDIIYKKQINSYKTKFKEQSRELQHMKNIIHQQKKHIQELTQQKHHPSLAQMDSRIGHSLSQTLKNEQVAHKISTPTISQKINHSNFILIHQSNNKSEVSNKVNNIEISTSKNSKSNKQNIFFNNGNKRSNTPQSMASSKIIYNVKLDSDKSKVQQKRQPSKPIINISMDNIKIKSPNIKFDSKDNYIQTVNTKGQDQKDVFLSRLKDMDKNLHRFSSDQLKGMVRQYQSNSYDLTKMETSMINKLKFVAKTSDKPNCLRKDRSLAK